MKNGKRRKTKAGIFFGAFFKTLLVLAVAAVIAGAVYVVKLASGTVPVTYEGIYKKIEKTSFLYDAEGNEIDKLYYTEDRELVKYDQLPDDLKHAFIAIEDKTFYKHHGINFKRMLGAIFYKMTGLSDTIGGTSTITQQLARNIYLSDIKSQRTLQRKVIEMIYAYKIEQALSKEQILEAYLNTIYLGYGCYGIDAAARTYFSKDASDLSLAESAALAALPQAPDSYALLQDEEGDNTTYLADYKIFANDNSKDRRDLVLSLMKEQGYITEEEKKAATVDISDIIEPNFGEEKATSKYTYFSDYVADVVAKDLSKEYSLTEERAEYMVHAGGIKIYSTLDSTAQDIITKEFADDSNFPSCAEEEPQAAMVITNAKTGEIVAMVGGRSGKGKKLFNRATSPRQPGSSIKPLTVYAAALQKSYEYAEKGEKFQYTDYGFEKQGTKDWGDYITASSLVTDEKMIVNGNVWPQNFSRSYSGNRTFRTALQQSLNTCAVKIQLQVGTDYSMELLKKFGITTAVDDSTLATNDLNSAAMGLGAMTYGTTPLELAGAYSVFPNEGVRSNSACYTKVVDSDGNVILENNGKQVQVLDAGVAFIMTDCLKSVVSKGIAGDARISGVEVGGKTGTTNDTADIWFCGFVPNYSAALWIGTDHNSQMNARSSQAAALWSRIMRQIPGVTEGEYPGQPSDVVQQWGEYYTSGTVPSSPTRDSGSRKTDTVNDSSERTGRESDSNEGDSESRSGRNNSISTEEDWVRGWQDSDDPLTDEEIDEEIENW